MNQQLKGYLWHFTSHHQDNWDMLLLFAEFSHNNHVHSWMQQCPFMVDTGRNPHMGFEPQEPRLTLESINDFMDHIGTGTGHSEGDSYPGHVMYDNHWCELAPVFSPGDKVWLDGSNIGVRGSPRPWYPTHQLLSQKHHNQQMVICCSLWYIYRYSVSSRGRSQWHSTSFSQPTPIKAALASHWRICRRCPLTIATNQPLSKLSHWQLGPFTVKACIGHGAYCLSLPPQLQRLHPVFPVVKLSVAIPDSIPGHWPALPLLLILINSEDEYEVKAILDSQMRYNHLEYLVKWKGLMVTIAGRCIINSVHKLKWRSSIMRIREQLVTLMWPYSTPFLSLVLTWHPHKDPRTSWHCTFEGGVM
jgi:hypothetical protein